MKMAENNNLSYPSGLAVEYYFDADSEAAIFAFRDTLYQKGITPVQGLMNDKPHISLAVFSKMDPGRLIQLVNDFSRKVSCFPLQLGAIGVFPTPDNVLFLYPAPSRKLLETHAQFNRILKREDLHSSSYYLPGNWVPHCTLEFNLPEDELCQAIQLSKSQFKPIKCKIMQLGVVAFRPIEYLAHFDLKDK